MYLAIFGAVMITLIHLIAIASGRQTNTREKRVAFASGLLGFLSIPVVIYFGIKSFCIAGMCRHMDYTAVNVATAAFVALTLLSLVSVVVIFVRRSRT